MSKSGDEVRDKNALLCTMRLPVWQYSSYNKEETWSPHLPFVCITAK